MQSNREKNNPNISLYAIKNNMSLSINNPNISLCAIEYREKTTNNPIISLYAIE